MAISVSKFPPHGGRIDEQMYVLEDLFADCPVPIPYHSACAVSVIGTDYSEITFFPVDTSQYHRDDLFFSFNQPNITDYDVTMDNICVVGFPSELQIIDYTAQAFDTEIGFFNVLSLERDNETDNSIWRMTVDFTDTNPSAGNTNRFDGLSGSPVFAYNPTTQIYKILGVVISGYHTSRILKFVSFLSPRLESVLRITPYI